MPVSPSARRRACRHLAAGAAALAALAACGDAAGPPTYFLAEVPDHFVAAHIDISEALLVARNDLVVNLVLARNRFDDLREADWGGSRSAQIADLVFRARLPDAFDFLIVTFDPARELLPVGSHARVRNDVVGLGYPLYHDGYRYGSTTRLRSVIMLREVRNLRDGPSLHEIAHHWGATLLPTVQGGHWGFAGVGGQLGGWSPGTLEEVEPGRYRGQGPTGMPFHTVANGGNRLPYAPLELYMMGFLPLDSVSPVEVAVNGLPFDMTDGVFLADSIRVVRRDEILGGTERDPSWLEAPRAFRALYVVVSPDPLDADAVDRLGADVREFARTGPDDRPDVFNFWEATGGRATIRFDGILEEMDR